MQGEKKALVGLRLDIDGRMREFMRLFSVLTDGQGLDAKFLGAG